MIDKKGEIRIAPLIIGLLCFGLFLGVILDAVVDINNNLNDTEVDNVTNAFLTKLRNDTFTIQNTAAEYKEQAPGGSDAAIDQEEVEFRDRMEKSGWQAIKDFPKMLTSFESMGETVGDSFELPRVFIVTLVISIILILTLILISSILRNVL